MKEILGAVVRFKAGLLACATDGHYSDEDFCSDLEIATSDKKINEMIPMEIYANRSPAAFRRLMQAKYKHYSDRRTYIEVTFSPIFEYLRQSEVGQDDFSFSFSSNELSAIGRGGYGIVYKYHHTLLDMDFAIKFFDPIFVSEEENKKGEERFFREAKILFSLNHENIVRIYDIGRSHGKPFIRMEYINGCTIEEYIDKHGTVSFFRTKKPILALLKGLQHAHALGIIHRDLKPTNFMVTKNGEFKIIDFGISTFLETNNIVKLTPSVEKIAGGVYIDPQLSENPKLRDVRSDIYSVGAIWYYLLVGHSPAGGDIRKELLESQHATEYESNIILKCLSRRLEDRYATCADLIELLDPKPKSIPSHPRTSPQVNITKVTKKAIFDFLIEQHEEGMRKYVYMTIPDFQEPKRVFNYHGTLTIPDFLEELYDIDSIPSTRERNLRQELIRHTVQNCDYEYDWIFTDGRLKLVSGNDNVLLKFLAHMFHPLVRSEKSNWESVLTKINTLLKQDGYEIFECDRISGKAVFSYRYLL